MKDDQANHRRKSIRLASYDYSQSGFYFITICTQDKASLFGRVIDGTMAMNAAGEQINQCWLDITKRFPSVELHHHIVMPNHLQSIIELVGAPLVGAQTPLKGQPPGIAPAVGDIAGAFKSLSTNTYISGVKQKGWQSFVKKLWQRNYYEHIIRTEDSFRQISEYIQTNPLRWQEDRYYIP